MIPTVGDFLGAPVMQIVTSIGSVVAMEGYENLDGLDENKEFASLIA